MPRPMNYAQVERPKAVKQKHLVFLDDLRSSGVTNMFGAVPYLRQFDSRLNRDSAVAVLSYWMKTFAERHGLKEPK